MSFRQFDIALQKTRAQQIKVRDYREKLTLEQGELPGEKKKALNQLSQTRDYLRKVKQYRKRELAQHKDIDKQVKGQEKKIVDAANNLRDQTRKARIHIGKFRHAAFESKKLAIQKYHYLVNNWWDNAIRGLEESISKQQQYIEIMIARSQNSMRKAILFGGAGYRKPRIIYHQHKPMSEGELYPNRGGIDSANKRISKIDDADVKQEDKIRKYKGDIDGAMASLGKRKKAAHARVDAAAKERDGQLVKGRQQEAALVKRIKYIEKRGDKLASEQDRMGTAAGQLANQRARFLRGRAQMAAQVKAAKAEEARKNRLRPKLEAAWKALQKADAATQKKMIKKFPQWFLKEKMSNRRR